VVDVVSAVLKCRALPDAAATLLAVPSARALGAKYFRRIEAQPQIADSDLVVDGHAGSVGLRTAPCDQRNKLLGSQRAAGRTGGNQISPALRLNLMETHRGPAQVPGLVIKAIRNGSVTPWAAEKHRCRVCSARSDAPPRPLQRHRLRVRCWPTQRSAMFARLREMLDRWLRRRKRSSA
jgi:hypothetical protein